MNLIKSVFVRSHPHCASWCQIVHNSAPNNLSKDPANSWKTRTGNCTDWSASAPRTDYSCVARWSNWTFWLHKKRAITPNPSKKLRTRDKTRIPSAVPSKANDPPSDWYVPKDDYLSCLAEISSNGSKGNFDADKGTPAASAGFRHVYKVTKINNMSILLLPILTLLHLQLLKCKQIHYY